MNILDKIRFIESEIVPKEGAQFEALGTSMKITHSCGCVLVRHLVCGQPGFSREENPEKFDLAQAERAYYIEMCQDHSKLFEEQIQ